MQQDSLGAALRFIGWCVESAANGAVASRSGTRVRERKIRENLIERVCKYRRGAIHTCDDIEMSRADKSREKIEAGGWKQLVVYASPRLQSTIRIAVSMPKIGAGDDLSAAKLTLGS